MNIFKNWFFNNSRKDIIKIEERLNNLESFIENENWENYVTKEYLEIMIERLEKFTSEMKDRIKIEEKLNRIKIEERLNNLEFFISETKEKEEKSEDIYDHPESNNNPWFIKEAVIDIFKNNNKSLSFCEIFDNLKKYNLINNEIFENTLRTTINRLTKEKVLKYDKVKKVQGRKRKTWKYKKEKD